MAGYLKALTVGPGLTVNDLARSLKFYEGLGFEIGERFEGGGELRGAMMVAGSGQIGISQDDFAKGRDREKGVGMRIWIETQQDIDDLAARARAAGIVLDADPADMPWGGRAFAVTDPDGFKITISKT